MLASEKHKGEEEDLTYRKHGKGPSPAFWVAYGVLTRPLL